MPLKILDAGFRRHDENNTVACPWLHYNEKCSSAVKTGFLFRRADAFCKTAELSARGCNVVTLAAPDRGRVVVLVEDFLEDQKLFFVRCAKINLCMLVKGIRFILQRIPRNSSAKSLAWRSVSFTSRKRIYSKVIFFLGARG